VSTIFPLHSASLGTYKDINHNANRRVADMKNSPYPDGMPLLFEIK